MLTVAIFTRWENKKLFNLLDDLYKQNINKFIIKIYSDKHFKNKEEIKITEWKNVAEKRNQAINECKTKFLFLIDDDNRIYNNNFLKNIIKLYNKIEYPSKIISPTILWRDTKKIQSAWIRFCYLLWKVIVNKKIKWEYRESKWIWWNSLFSETNTFKKTHFDKNIWYIREDIDYCYSLQEKWTKIFVWKLWINHIERDKNIAEKSFIFWELYNKKIKNRDIFVEKHSNKLQKIIYRWFWYYLWIIYWKILRKLTKIKKT